MPATVTLHTAGECRILVRDAAHTTTLTPASDRLFTLTLLLAADAGRPIPRTRLAEWLWPDGSAAGARHALRQLLYRLRQLGVPLTTDGAHVVLPPDAVVDPGDDAPATSARCLPGWEPTGAAVAAWADRYRAATEARMRTTLARSLEHAQAAGRDAAPLAATLLDLDPHHPLARATLQPRAVREPSPDHRLPLVGRDDALRTLRLHALAACDGRGAAVVVAAPPHAGTTRLLAEFARLAAPLGLTVVRPEHPASFQAALAAVVRALLARPGALGAAPLALRAARRFVASAAAPVGAAPLHHLGVALAELARAVAAERPLALVFDAPRTTPADRALSAAFARALAGAPTLAAFTAGAGHPRPPVPDTSVVSLRLLHDCEADQLAAAAARARGGRLSPADLVWCTAMGGGRPGHVIALAHACAARRGSRVLPAVVRVHLRDALAGLPPRTRETVAIHALLGDVASPATTAHVLGRRIAAVASALHAVRRCRLGGLPADAGPFPRDAARAVAELALATLDPEHAAALRARAACAR